MVSAPPSRSRITWKCGVTPSASRSTASICAGRKRTPLTTNMSSVRLTTCAMRAEVRPQAQGSGVREVRSPVRYRSSGKASFPSVVITSSPVSPAGDGSPVAGFTISQRK